MSKTSWNTVEGKSDCGYAFDQHVIESGTVSAKVWKDRYDDVHMTFDTDESPSIECMIRGAGESGVKLGKLFIEQVLIPVFDKKNY